MSVRLTVAHTPENVDAIRSVLRCSDGEPRADYVIYPHLGVRRDNPHYHILCPVAGSAEHAAKEVEKYRRRFKSAFPGLSGNGFLRMKIETNDIEKGIQYCSRENTDPIYASDEAIEGDPGGFSMIVHKVENAPPWEDRRMVQSMLPLDPGNPNKKPRVPGDWLLTYNNLVAVAVDYARKRGSTGSLKATVKDMLKNTKWQPSKWMLTGGVPSYYSNLFDRRTGRANEDDVDMEWWDRSGI